MRKLRFRLEVRIALNFTSPDYELIFSEELPSQKVEKDVEMQQQTTAPVVVPKLLSLVKGIPNVPPAEKVAVIEQPAFDPSLASLVSRISNEP